jgi:hypothetical protein
MRIKRFATWLVLAIAVAYAYAARRRRGVPVRRAVPPPPLPVDPSELVASPRPAASPERVTSAEIVEPTEIDINNLVRPDEAGQMHIETLGEDGFGELDLDAAPEPDVPASDAMSDPSLLDPIDPIERDRISGDLYGVHVASAVDLDLPDDDQAQAEGENWLEHLEATSAELGPEPGRRLDMTDESDRRGGPRRSATTDTPVADLGSGGPRGL